MTTSSGCDAPRLAEEPNAFLLDEMAVEVAREDPVERAGRGTAVRAHRPGRTRRPAVAGAPRPACVRSGRARRRRRRGAASGTRSRTRRRACAPAGATRSRASARSSSACQPGRSRRARRPTSRRSTARAGRSTPSSARRVGACSRSSRFRTSAKGATRRRSTRSATRWRAHARLLDVHADADHNRSVFTLVGSEDELGDALVAGVGVAVERIDLDSMTVRTPASAPRTSCRSCRSARRTWSAHGGGRGDRREDRSARAAGVPLRAARARPGVLPARRPRRARSGGSRPASSRPTSGRPRCTRPRAA